VKRTHRKIKPAIMLRTAPKATKELAAVVCKLVSHDEYDRLAMEWHGPRAIEMAKRGRSLRELARATGLSPTYLSVVAAGRQRISLYALHALLCECEGMQP
jgi:hypothetical protein